MHFNTGSIQIFLWSGKIAFSWFCWFSAERRRFRLNDDCSWDHTVNVNLEKLSDFSVFCSRKDFLILKINSEPGNLQTRHTCKAGRYDQIKSKVKSEMEQLTYLHRIYRYSSPMPRTLWEHFDMHCGVATTFFGCVAKWRIRATVMTLWRWSFGPSTSLLPKSWAFRPSAQSLLTKKIRAVGHLDPQNPFCQKVLGI